MPGNNKKSVVHGANHSQHDAFFTDYTDYTD